MLLEYFLDYYPKYFWSTFELLWSTLFVLLDYFWTTYNNSIVLSCIEFILGMEIPKSKKDKPLTSLLW